MTGELKTIVGRVQFELYNRLACRIDLPDDCSIIVNRVEVKGSIWLKRLESGAWNYDSSRLGRQKFVNDVSAPTKKKVVEIMLAAWQKFIDLHPKIMYQATLESLRVGIATSEATIRNNHEQIATLQRANIEHEQGIAKLKADIRNLNLLDFVR